jgi:hypothetical protein
MEVMETSVVEMSAMPAATTAVHLGACRSNAADQQRNRGKECQPKLSHWFLLRSYLSVRQDRPYQVRPARPDRRARTQLVTTMCRRASSRYGHP